MTNYEAIRQQLEAKLEQLVARAEEIDSNLNETRNEDWEERATEAEGDEVMLSMGNVTVKEIEEIKRALHQIDHGNYGICSRCGTQIPAERLELLPYATTCTKCA
jgi:RNA polymerase-binding protein DksA